MGKSFKKRHLKRGLSREQYARGTKRNNNYYTAARGGIRRD